MTTEQGNKLIAEFMGFRAYSNTGVYIKNRDTEHQAKFVLAYDSCWSELMPVVEKIESLSVEEDYEVAINKVTVSIHGNSIPKLTHISPTHTTIFRVIGDEPECKKIVCLWECIIEFIEWLNKEQKVERSVANEAQLKNKS